MGESLHEIVDLKTDISGKLAMPHLSYGKLNLASKNAIAVDVLLRKNEEITLITSSGIGTSAVFAGLTEKTIEYLAINAPSDYKKEIWALLDNSAEVDDILEIAKNLDDDLGRGATKNQERVKNVMQYVKDNRMVFEF